MTLIWATMGMLLVSGIVLVGTDRARALDRIAEVDFAVEGQARQLAESGLVDALAWLRGQKVQPVTSFSPVLDPTADPPVDETDDPSVGLVRTFEISSGLWGRYVVRRGQDHEDFVDLNGNGIYDPGEKVYDLDGNRRRTMAWGSRDLTHKRQVVGAGAVWFLESEGQVFTRPRGDLPLGEGPNHQLARVVLGTEVRRLTIAPPASAAIVTSQGKDVHTHDLRVTSPVQGFAYRQDTGGPNLHTNTLVTAPTIHGAVPGWEREGGFLDDGERRLSIEELFGVTQTTLASMADISTGEETPRPKASPWKKDRIPTTFPDDSLVYIDHQKGHVHFDKKYPLRGQGILVINGTLHIRKDSNSDFRGILIVLGETKIEGPARFTGMIISQKKFNTKGKKGRLVEVDHDLDLVGRMIATMGRYRRSKSSFVPPPFRMDGRPDESLMVRRRLEAVEFEATHVLSDAERILDLP